MKSSRFSDAQKAFILKQGDAGGRYLPEGRDRISRATAEMRWLEQLEDENVRSGRWCRSASRQRDAEGCPEAQVVDEMRGDGLYGSGGLVAQIFSEQPWAYGIGGAESSRAATRNILIRPMQR
jgi:hypothetical protein